MVHTILWPLRGYSTTWTKKVFFGSPTQTHFISCSCNYWNLMWFRIIKTKLSKSENHSCTYVLKYGFCNKVISERWNSDELNTFTTYLFSLLGVIAIVFSNHAQKWEQICCKIVQLDRVAFFRSLFLSKLAL